jgi:uncharacterized protein YecT (DUF1311 family)
MYVLSEKDINRLIILCAEKAVATSDKSIKQEYQHLLNKLKTYKDQNHATSGSSNLK